MKRGEILLKPEDECGARSGYIFGNVVYRCNHKRGHEGAHVYITNNHVEAFWPNEQNQGNSTTSLESEQQKK